MKYFVKYKQARKSGNTTILVDKTCFMVADDIEDGWARFKAFTQPSVVLVDVTPLPNTN